MKSKINWYREVLEIEPQSKVFFPLAKLFIENEQYQEAFKTLQQGLLRHPEFVEAKLLLVEVLAHLDKTEELDEIVEDIASGFGEYPAFWESWARQLAQEKDGYDPALAMRLLAAYFSGKTISWAKIIEYGLKSLLGEQQASAKPRLTGVEAVAKSRLSVVRTEITEDDDQELEEDEDTDDTGEQDDMVDAADALPLDHDDRPEALEDTGDDGPVSNRSLENIEAAVADADLDSDEIEGAASTMKEIQEAGDEKEDERQEDEEEYDEGDEETFSLRTKTMADLLAEQGDYDGALDIYRELIIIAPDEATRKELEDLANDMRRLSQEKPGSAGGKVKKGSPSPQKVESKGLKSKTKLISALEALASRLEAKAAH